MSSFARGLGVLALLLVGIDALAADLLGSVSRLGKPQVGKEVCLTQAASADRKEPTTPKPASTPCKERKTKTNAAGNYLFQDVRPGLYVLTCNDQEQLVDVPPGASRKDCKD